MAIFRRGPLTGASNAGGPWGRQKSRFWANIWLHCVLSTQRVPGVINTMPLDRAWQVVTLITGSKWRSLLMARDVDEMFMTRSLSVTPKTTKTTKQHLIARSNKSVAYVTNNKRLRWVRSTFCTIEVNYWQTRSTRGLFAIAELLVLFSVTRPVARAVARFLR